MMGHGTLRIYLFYCSNSLSREELACCCGKLEPNQLKVISLPCSGKVNMPYMVKAFETGADGVIIVTCEKGQCRHLEGNMRAQKRAEAVDSLLEEIGMGRGRITTIEFKEDQTEQVVEKIGDFCAKIRDLPRSCAQRAACSTVDDAHQAQPAAATARRRQ